jgi:hypothetical protein
MGQRGIPKDLVDLTLKFGQWEGDRCRLDRRSLKPFSSIQTSFDRAP